jgi:hypothetical protein
MRRFDGFTVGAVRRWSPRFARSACFTRLRDESGQALVLAVIMMTAVIGFVGLAVDVGQARLASRQLQTIADAVAVAASQQLTQCGLVTNCAAMATAAKASMVENGIATSTFVQNCGAASTSGFTLTLNNAPCALGSTTADPHYGNTSYVEAVLTRVQPTFFANVLGVPNLTLKARAEAKVASPTACLWALDPTGASSLNIGTLAAVNSPCGIVVESSNPGAINCNLLSSLTASQIQVVGGVFGALCGISPTPTVITTPNPADPLAYLPVPSVGGCGLTTVSPYTGATNQVTVGLFQTVVFNPGTYCGGISIGLGATATFMPGTYVLTSSHGAGGLSVYLGATVTGNGVTFYNYGPSGAVNFSTSLVAGNVNFTAPTSGTYSGILFFQDPGNTTAANLNGATTLNTVLQGTYYFPTATVNFAFDGFVTYSILVAKDIYFAPLTGGLGLAPTGSNNANLFTSLVNGSPLYKSTGVLSQ